MPGTVVQCLAVFFVSNVTGVTVLSVCHDLSQQARGMIGMASAPGNVAGESTDMS